MAIVENGIFSKQDKNGAVDMDYINAIECVLDIMLNECTGAISFESTVKSIPDVADLCACKASFAVNYNEEVITIGYNSEDGNIENADGGFELVYETRKFGRGNICYEGFNLRESKAVRKVLPMLADLKDYSYARDAIKWYSREEAIKKISERIRDGSLDFAEVSREIYDVNNFDYEFGEGYEYIVYEADYADEHYILSFLDSFEALKRVKEKAPEDAEYRDLYYYLAPRIKITIGEYYESTLYDLSPKETSMITGYDPETIKVEDVLVRATNARCYERDHSVERIKAKLYVIPYRTGRKTLNEINAYYCSECNRYYILERDFIELREIGVICCRIVDIKELGKITHSGWAEISILRSYGYNVSKKDGLSDDERHQILDMIIANGIMTRERCIDFILWLVSRHSGRPNMTFAISKWNSDVDYLRNGVWPNPSDIIVGSVFSNSSK